VNSIASSRVMGWVAMREAQVAAHIDALIAQHRALTWPAPVPGSMVIRPASSECGENREDAHSSQIVRGRYEIRLPLTRPRCNSEKMKRSISEAVSVAYECSDPTLRRLSTWAAL